MKISTQQLAEILEITEQSVRRRFFPLRRTAGNFNVDDVLWYVGADERELILYVLGLDSQYLRARFDTGIVPKERKL
jgi:hypothetical protein